MKKKLEKLIKEEQGKLIDWIQNSDCNDVYTEEYMVGRIDGLKLALDAITGGK